MENPKEFKYQLYITLIDKLVIALVLVLVAYFIDRSLTRLETQEAEKMETFKGELAQERQSYQNQFTLMRDSLEREFKNYQLLNERIYKRDRSDLIRRENQFYKERNLYIENQHRLALESQKQNNSFSSYLTKASVESIALTWSEINKLSIGSRVVQENLIDFEELIEANFDIPVEGLEGLNTVREFEQGVLDYGQTFVSLMRADMSLMSLRANLEGAANSERDRIERKIRSLSEERSLLQLEADSFRQELDRIFTFLESQELQDKKREIEDGYIEIFYKTLGTDVEEQFSQITIVEAIINENAFWLSPGQRDEMYEFLTYYFDYINAYPFARTPGERAELNEGLEARRQDIYDLRGEIFSELKVAAEGD